MTLTASRGNAAFVLPGFVRIDFSLLIIFPQIDQWQCILRHKPHNCSVLTPKILFLTGFEPTIFLAGVHVDRARIDLLQRVLFKQFQLCSTIFFVKIHTFRFVQTDFCWNTSSFVIPNFCLKVPWSEFLPHYALSKHLFYN
jgi:hypothetical protein